MSFSPVRHRANLSSKSSIIDYVQEKISPSLGYYMLPSVPEPEEAFIFTSSTPDEDSAVIEIHPEEGVVPSIDVEKIFDSFRFSEQSVVFSLNRFHVSGPMDSDPACIEFEFDFEDDYTITVILYLQPGS